MSIHTPVVVLSFFSKSFSSFLLTKKRTYIVMKKEKHVEKWISLGALSLVASLQERSTLQNRRRNRQDFLKGKTIVCSPQRGIYGCPNEAIASWYAKKRVG